MKSRIQLIILTLMLILLLPLLVSAFGISSPFWDNRPMIIHPGESQDVSLEFQNMVGEKDITFKGSITEGQDIVTILDAEPTYFVPFGSKHVQAKIRVSISENAKTGETKKVGVSFAQVLDRSESGKMIQLAGGVKASFPVVIESREKPEEETSLPATTIFISVGIVLGGAVVGYALFRKRGSNGL